MATSPQANDPQPLPAGMAEAAVPFVITLGAERGFRNTPTVPPLRPSRRPEPRDPLEQPPEARLSATFGPANCLAAGVLPWASTAAETLVAVRSLAHFRAARSRLAACFGPHLRPVETPLGVIETTMLALHGPALAAAAETRAAPQDSCRTFDAQRLSRQAAALLLVLSVLLLLAPLALLAAGFLIAALALAVNTGFKLATSLATLRRAPLPPPPPLAEGDLPSISLLIALYGEADIAPRLVARIDRLDYPRDRLEVLVIVEDDDHATSTALAAASLPPYMRLLRAPAGTIRTKPRALNLALDFARGDIVGVYDAEDAPEPDQLRKVAAAFAAAPPRIACVQAMLDFYNPGKNWLARCFTLEYALWFRLVLPGMERLGLPIPLGGTSVFLHRARLVGFGGWDAHNVTEDADLGICLARRGFATRMIASTTYEEANCRALPWVRQRSRWIKGYLMTWAVHMRSPRLLHAQLGTRGFLGFQIVFLGTLAQSLLAPLLLSLWTIPLGLGHPLMALLPKAAFLPLATLFLWAEATGTVLSLLALRRSGQRLSPLWIPALHAYFPLGTLAAAKALAETLRRPFYWDKTRHGQFHDER